MTGRISPLGQFAILAGPLLCMIDSAIVAVMVVPVATDLAVSPVAAQRIVSVYLVALGVGLIGVPLLSRAMSPMRLYVAAMLVFLLASAACGAAPNLEVLIAARAVQGLAAAPLVPVAMAVLYPGGERGSDLVGAAAGVILFAVPAIAPALGGSALAYVDWRWLFGVNVPVAAAACLCLRRIPERALPAATRTRVRWWQLASLLPIAVGVGLWSVAADELPTATVSATLPYVVAGTLAVAAGVAIALRQRRPAFRVDLLRSPSVVVPMLVIAAATVVTYAMLVLIPVFVQTVRHGTAMDAGLVLLPSGIATGLASVGAAALTRRLGARTTVVLGLLGLAAGSAAMVGLDEHTPLPLIATVLAARSLGMGLIAPTLVAELAAAVPQEDTVEVHSLFNVVQRVAGGIGVGTLAGVMVRLARSHGQLAAFQLIGWVMAAIAVAAVAVFLLAALRRPEQRSRQAGR